MTAQGHQDAFAPPRLSARCRFGQRPLAGTWGNGHHAPKPDLYAAAGERGELRTFTCDSATAERSVGQHVHPSGRSASPTDAFSPKVDGFLTSSAILCV